MSEGQRGEIEYVTHALLDRLCATSHQSARGRMNHNFHQPHDGYQRLLNVVQPGSYIRPHRHREPAKSESFVVVRGEIGFFTFDDDGAVQEARRLGSANDALAVDLQPGVWHCFAALQPNTVVFEGKNGPYDPATDKEFPNWAPAEGSVAAASYLQQLLARLGGRTPSDR